MFYTLTWILMLGLLACWSLAAWAFHSIAAWAVLNAGALVGGAAGGVAGGVAGGSLLLPDWLVPWVPPQLAQALTSMLSAFAPAIESLVSWAPAMGGVLSVAFWVVWAIGSALLVMLGVALTGVIAVVRRRTSRIDRSSAATRASAHATTVN